VVLPHMSALAPYPIPCCLFSEGYATWLPDNPHTRQGRGAVSDSRVGYHMQVTFP